MDGLWQFLTQTTTFLQRHWRAGVTSILVLSCLALVLAVVPLQFGETLDYLRNRIGYGGFLKIRLVVAVGALAGMALAGLVLATGGHPSGFRGCIRSYASGACTNGLSRFRAFTASVSPAEWLAFMTIFILGGVLRFHYGMNRLPEHDELHTLYRFVRQWWVYVLTNWSSNNNHWFFTVLSYLSCKAFGDSLLAFRLPAVIAGWMSIGLMWLVTRRLISSPAAIVACLLLAVSENHLYYSANGRGYTLQIALMLLGIWIGLGVIGAQRFVGLRFLLFAMTHALAIYTIPTSVIPIFGVSLWLMAALLFMADVPRRALKLWGLFFSGVLGVLMGLLLMMPLVGLYGLEPITKNPFTMPVTTEVFLERFGPRIVMTIDLWLGEYPRLLGRAALIIAAVGALLCFRRETSPVPIAVCMVIGTAVVLLVQSVVPYPRVLLFLLPFVFISIGGAADGLIGLIARWRPIPANAAMPASVAAGVVALALCFRLLQSDFVVRGDETGAFRSAAILVDRIKESWEPGDVLLCNEPAFNGTKYQLEHRGLDWKLYSIAGKYDPIASGTRVWLVMKVRAATPLPGQVPAALGLDPSAIETVLQPSGNDGLLQTYVVP